MKKIYSFVLMAMMLLIGTNVWADNVAKIHRSPKDSLYTSLEGAWADVRDGETIELLADCNPTKTLWLGTTTMADSTHVKSITLNLGTSQEPHHIIFNFTQSKPAFFITHGSLNVIGTGSISLGNVSEQNGYSLDAGTVGGVYTTNASHWVAFHVTGSTYQEVDPSDSTQTPYTHLTIGKDVTIYSQGIGICVDNLKGATSAGVQWPLASTGVFAAKATKDVEIPSKGFETRMYKTTSGGSDKGRGLAYGVRVDLKGTINAGKYGIKANTELAGPSNPINSNLSGFYKSHKEGEEDVYTSGNAAFNATYAPYIKIYKGAEVTEVNTMKDGIAGVYSGGYARWQIEGKCEGSAGIAIKSGEVTLAGDAEIASNYENGFVASGDQALDRGFEGGGSGLVVMSSDLGVGDTEVTISGNVTITGAGGYAVEEVISTNNSKSTVESIEIKGGKFEQGATGQGIIAITNQTASGTTVTNTSTVSISGGTFEGDEDGVTIGAQSLQGFLQTQREQGQDTHGVIVYVDPVTNDQTVVISPGPAPTVANNVVATPAHDEEDYINWINAGDTRDTLVADLKLAELQISQDYEQILVIPDGLSLEVGRVVLGAKAKIIVKAGGKFIVSDTTGIASFQESNLILENEPGKRSIFLFHPDVTSNIHPMATYQLTTNSWRVSSTNSQAEVFGVPTYQAITSIGCTTDGKHGYIQRYGQNGTWENIAFTDANPFPYEQLNKPFAAYALTAYRAQDADPLTFEFGGELVGNQDAALNANMKWSFFANSYTAEIDLAKFLEGLEDNAQNVTKYVYVSTVQPNGHWRWDAIDASFLTLPGAVTKLQPMQGFLLNNKGGVVEENAIKYETMVYAPAVPGYTPSAAPRREVVANENTAMMFVVVTAEDGAYDNVKFRESDENASCEKFMNEDVNIYASAEEKSAIVAAEDLANTYVGFSTVKGGEFTISFANVDGRQFDIIDLESGARINIEQGNEYKFMAADNYTNDYRFKIVEREEVVTAIENTEAVKNVKGIYTITGQYVGEMNLWNTLPAGVYVIDGAKCVK